MSSSLSYPEGVPLESATKATGSRRTGVLAVLKQASSPLTIPEIAKANGCAAITVRRHLGALLREGSVVRVLGPDGKPRRRPRLGEDGKTALPSRGRDQYIAA